MLRVLMGGARRATLARLALALACSASSALFVAKDAAAASDEERAAARNLAEKGRSAYDAKRYAEAIDLFKRAETLVHSPIHLLFIGRASVATGELVRAQEAFLKASREVLDANAPASRVQAVDAASRELENVRARVAEVTVSVKGAPKPHLNLDGNDVSDVLVGVPMPIDPGNHRVEARADGYFSAFREFNLAEGQKEQLSLELVANPEAPKPTLDATSETHETDASGAQGTPAEQPKVGERSTGFLIASIGGFVLAAGGAGFGTYKVVQGLDEEKQAGRLYKDCGSSCQGPTSARINAANGYYDDSILPYVIGGAGLAAGTTFLVLYLVSGGESSTASRLPVTPWVTANGFGVSGRF